MRKRTAILISGRGSNMVALIEAARDPAYPAEIALVVSNNPVAPGLARAREAGITTAAIDHRAFGKDRAGFEAALQSVLEAHGIELVCLAGFMRLLTAEFVSKWQGRMINIHPALLPDFKGLDTHARAHRGRREDRHGATVHFVVPEMDSGPDHRASGRAGSRRRHTPDVGGARDRRRAQDLPGGAARRWPKGEPASRTPTQQKTPGRTGGGYGENTPLPGRLRDPEILRGRLAAIADEFELDHLSLIEER